LVIFALPPSARAQLDDLVSKIDIDTKIISLESFYEEITGKVPLDFIDNVWLSDIIRRVGRRHYIGVKRIFDIIFALVGLIITVIIFPFIALAIKLDSSGPIFYIQKRVGKNGKNFNLYKFRTMAQNAEINGPQWSIGLADPRITRVGKFMRAIHIDEFPQFVNILKGNMSFVGPRPERPEFVEDLKKIFLIIIIAILLNPDLPVGRKSIIKLRQPPKKPAKNLNMIFITLKTVHFFRYCYYSKNNPIAVSLTFDSFRVLIPKNSAFKQTLEAPTFYRFYLTSKIIHIII